MKLRLRNRDVNTSNDRHQLTVLALPIIESIEVIVVECPVVGVEAFPVRLMERVIDASVAVAILVCHRRRLWRYTASQSDSDKERGCESTHERSNEE